jgi:OOP family OmpA-OmpF porin
MRRHARDLATRFRLPPHDASRNLLRVPSCCVWLVPTPLGDISPVLTKGRQFMIRNHFGITAVFLTLLCTSTAWAQDTEDSPGSEDHPLVTRYAGSIIDGYEVKDFTTYTLPLGPAVQDASGERSAAESVTLEGKVTRVLYRGPEERATLEILRNYQSALEAAGFETVFSCTPDDCGRLFHWIFYKEMEQRISNTRTSGSAFDIPQELHYLAARGSVGGETIHVSVLVAFDAGFSPLSKRPVTLLEVIESEAMDTGMVTINAEAMAAGIDATGRISIYGIYFDTDAAEIRPESASTLEQIATLLGNRPDLDLLVVGHTDNQGAYDLNMDLSSRRAESVARVLVEDYGVAEDRLSSDGVGYLSPVASNDTEPGRARHRRVELVKP